METKTLEKAEQILIGALSVCAIFHHWYSAAFVFVLGGLVYLTIQYKKVRAAKDEKVLILSMPAEAHEDIKKSAALSQLGLTQFATIAFSLVAPCIPAIKAGGKIIIQHPGHEDQVIDSI